MIMVSFLPRLGTARHQAPGYKDGRLLQVSARTKKTFGKELNSFFVRTGRGKTAHSYSELANLSKE
jgi:hypothetical protein